MLIFHNNMKLLKMKILKYLFDHIILIYKMYDLTSGLRLKLKQREKKTKNWNQYNVYIFVKIEIKH